VYSGGINMFDETLELADNKLLLLYIFNKIKYPVSNLKITQIVLENDFMNYFTFQQYLTELINSNLLKVIENENKKRINITDLGAEVLAMFENRLSSIKKEKANQYLNKRIDLIKKELTVSSDFNIDNENSYIVNLKAFENEKTLIDIKLNIATNKQANDLCIKWRNDASELYNKVINLLISD
jgi:predicted transcriptional regulator